MANEFKVKKGLIVDGTGTVLDIQGTQGQLFSVTDSLTGDLFSVSDISGVPIFNVNSSGMSTFDGDVTIDKDSARLILQDNSTGNALNQWISYRDSAGTERAYLGYGSTNNSTFYVVNHLSDIHFHANGAARFKVGSDVHVLGGTDFAIAAGRKLFFDGQVHTYISEESDSNLKFYVGGSEMVNFTNDKLFFSGSGKWTGNVSGTSTGCAEIGRNHAYHTMELKGYGAELMIGAQSTSINVNYRTCNSGTSGHTPTDWFWRAGSSSSYSDHHFGKVKAEDLIFGDTGGNGSGRLIHQNDTSGNQGSVGYGVLKQRDVNRQSVAGQSTHIGGYIWYTIKIPSGYSNQGLGSDVEVVVRTGGRHHNGKTLQKFLISTGNGTTANIGNFNGINILQTLDTRIAGSYGGSATTCEFYYRTSVANNTGEVILRLYRADREPVTVVEINPQVAWASNSTTFTPSLVCHGLGTTFDSGTGKGQINQTRPTSNLSTALVIQKAGFTQTTGTNGKLDVSANGPASGNPHEIARLVNLGSLATSSYMYIGASSGTDWRMGKNIMGVSGNTHFGITKHSGTTTYLEINSGTGVVTSSSGFYSPQYAQGNQALIKSNNGHAVFGSNSASVPLGFARDANHATYTDMTISTAGNMTVGGTCQYSGTGVTSINIKASQYPVLAFYAGASNSLYTSIFSYYNKTTFAHSASNASWEFENGGVRATISGAGKITAANDVVAYSDRKLKKNIKTLDGSKVLKMRGVSFTRKETGEDSSGVIAQEIQEVAPELISASKDGTLGVAYGNLVGYLIEAVKDQQKQIDELKKLIK